MKLNEMSQPESPNLILSKQKTTSKKLMRREGITTHTHSGGSEHTHFLFGTTKLKYNLVKRS